MSITVLIAPDFALSPALEDRWLQRLPPQRREQLARWPDHRARHRSLLGSRLLDAGLRRLGYANAPLTSLRYPPFRRPTLELPVDFSISHCEGRILCALSTSGPVGVDVEAIGDLYASDFLHYLNTAERQWAGRDARRFYSVWTRKEAVVKAADARGLPAVPGVDTAEGAQRADFAGQAWQTAEIAVGRGHMAHLAVRDCAAAPTVLHVSRRRLERDGLYTDAASVPGAADGVVPAP